MANVKILTKRGTKFEFGLAEDLGVSMDIFKIEINDIIIILSLILFSA